MIYPSVPGFTRNPVNNAGPVSAVVILPHRIYRFQKTYKIED